LIIRTYEEKALTGLPEQADIDAVFIGVVVP
jgi:hypothetical protein